MNSTMFRPTACQMPIVPSAYSAVSGFFSQSVPFRPTSSRAWLTSPALGWKANWNTSAIASSVEATGRK
jgi:hypothetical protein